MQEEQWRGVVNSVVGNVDEIRDRLMAALSASGHSYRKIGLVLRCNASTVCRHLRKLRRGGFEGGPEPGAAALPATPPGGVLDQ